MRIASLQQISLYRSADFDFYPKGEKQPSGMKIIPGWNPTKIFSKLKKKNTKYKDFVVVIFIIFINVYIYN